MSKRKELLFFFLLLFPFFLQSQFKEGFIISLQGDTIHGEIYRKFIPNPYDQCRFRSDDRVVSEFSPSDIKAYGYKDGKFYTSELLSEKFAEVLISGKISLYKANNKLYVKKEGFDFFEVGNILETEKYSSSNSSGTPRWKGGMMLITSDCDLKLIDEDTGSGPGHVANIIKAYHACIGEPYVEYDKSTPYFKFEPGIYIGTGLAEFSMKELARPYGTMYDSYSVSTNYLGLSLTLSGPRFSERLALEADLRAGRTSIHSIKANDDNSGKLYNEAFFDLNTIYAGLHLKYAIYKSRFSSINIQYGVYFYDIFPKMNIITEKFNDNHLERFETVPVLLLKKRVIWSGGLNYAYQFPKFKVGAGIFYNDFDLLFNMFYTDIKQYTIRLTFSK